MSRGASTHNGVFPGEAENTRISLLTVKRIGLLAGPLLGLLCYHLLPLHYSTGEGQWVEFTQAGRATLGLMMWMATWWVTEAVGINARRANLRVCADQSHRQRLNGLDIGIIIAVLPNRWNLK